MKNKLNRTIYDRLGSMVILAITCGIVYLYHEELGLFGILISILAILGALVNFIFINFTPIAKINGTNLCLYAESQPIIFTIKPNCFNTQELNNVEIKKGFLEFRAIFSLPHGRTVYHSFPAVRETRIKLLFQFLCDNLESELITMAYNKSLKPGTSQSDTP